MRNIFYGFLFTIILTVVATKGSNETNYYRTYKCRETKCIQTVHLLTEIPLGQGSSRPEIEHSTIEACRLSCDPFGSLWPIPTGQIILGFQYVRIHHLQFAFDTSSIPENASSVFKDMIDIFLSNLQRSYNDDDFTGNVNSINVVINVTSSDLNLDWMTNESYALELAINDSDKNGTIKITADTVYGARHGLETLLQLTAPVILQRDKRGLVILRSANITDAPVFVHRGLVLDTARNFVPVTDILRTIDGLSSCKMNVLHWHATDSQSFPLHIKRVPFMTVYGSYSPNEIYTTNDTELIIAYGKLRGVRVILELDMPAHSGHGWEWSEETGLGSLAVCVNAQPWRKFCIQPPCGQLNPTNPNLYDVLREIYKDAMDVWGPSEVFHMGGDEVYIPCWNLTKEITDQMKSRGMGLHMSDFLQLWSEFQNSLLAIVDEERRAAGVSGSNVSAILWSSKLTNPEIIEKYLDKDRYIIHTWFESSSPIPQQLLKLGYKLIISTKNAWYLDHGVWGITIYHTWRDMYINRIPKQNGVLGGEVASWGEYVDGGSLDPRIWPRAAAVAERLWSDPPKMSTEKAEPRLQSHRSRLKIRGIKPEAIAPEWCALHDGQCQ